MAASVRPGQPALHSNVQVNQCYIVRSCLKRQDRISPLLFGWFQHREGAAESVRLHTLQTGDRFSHAGKVFLRPCAGVSEKY